MIASRCGLSIREEGAHLFCLRARSLQFVCWSELYYFYTDRFDERWEISWEAWRAVGRHLHFAKPLLEIVNRYRELVLGDASEQVSSPSSLCSSAISLSSPCSRFLRSISRYTLDTATSDAGRQPRPISLTSRPFRLSIRSLRRCSCSRTKRRTAGGRGWRSRGGRGWITTGWRRLQSWERGTRR